MITVKTFCSALAFLISIYAAAFQSQRQTPKTIGASIVNSLPTSCNRRTAARHGDAIVLEERCVANYKRAPFDGSLLRSAVSLPLDNSTHTSTFGLWTDVTEFGARAVNTIPSARAEMIAGHVTVRLNGGSQEFQNGDGVTVYGAGAPIRMSTPAAPKVTPSLATGGTGLGGGASTNSGIIVPSADGQSIYLYKIIARDILGGLTASSPATTISNGQETLGLHQSNVVSMSRANSTVTVTLSTASLIVPGALVHFSGASNADFDGWFSVTSVSGDGTVLSINNTPVDARGIGWTVKDSNFSRGGRCSFYVSNHLHWPIVKDAWEYYIYAKRAGSDTYKLIGQTKPSSMVAGVYDVQFDDYGSPFNDDQRYPSYVPEKPPTAPQNDPLTTKVVSGGGTSELTLADPAIQTVSTLQIVFDDAPAIKAAANSMVGVNGSLYFPPSALHPGARYVVASYLQLPNILSIKQAGSLYLNESVELGTQTTWNGDMGSSAAIQFSFAAPAAIQIGTANPGIYSPIGSVLHFSNLTIESSATNGGTAMVIDNGNMDMDYVQFLTGGGGPAKDYLSMNIVLRTTSSGGNNFNFHKTLFNAGTTQATDRTWTPLIYFAPGQTHIGIASNYQSYVVRFSECFWNIRGVEEETAAGLGGFFYFDGGYRQGGITPFLSVGNSLGITGVLVRFHELLQDTESVGTLATWGNGGSVGAYIDADLLLNDSSDIGGVPPPFTGFAPSQVQVSTSLTGKIPSRQGSDCEKANAVVFPYETSDQFAPSPENLCAQLSPLHFPSQYEVFWDLPAPNNVRASVKPGDGVRDDTYDFIVTAIGPDGGETIPSTIPGEATTHTGSSQVLVEWTGVIGAVSYNLYVCQLSRGPCVEADGRAVYNNYRQTVLHTTLNPFRWVDSRSTGNPPTRTGTGSTIISPRQIVAPYFTCPETAPPPAIPGFDIFFCSSATHMPSTVSGNGVVAPIANGISVIASGRVSLSTNPIPPHSCSANVTSIADGATEGDNVLADFAGDASNIQGYGGGVEVLSIYKFISKGTIVFKVCNWTTKTIIPGAVAMQWRVIR